MSYNIIIELAAVKLVIPSNILISPNVVSQLSIDHDSGGAGSHVRWVFEYNGCMHDSETGDRGSQEETSSVPVVVTTSGVHEGSI